MQAQNNNTEVFLCRNKTEYDYLIKYLSDKGYHWPMMNIFSVPYTEPKAIYVNAETYTIKQSDIDWFLMFYDIYPYKEASLLMRENLLSAEKSAPNLPQL